MKETKIPPYCAFEGNRCVGRGGLVETVLGAKAAWDAQPHASILLFESATSRQIEIDFRGATEEVIARLTPHETTASQTVPVAESTAGDVKPGRPKLGVVAREVTLLPRHWEWLGQQSGGASVALRKLVEDARRANAVQDEERQRREAIGRFMMVIAGNLPGFEEASRALYRGERARFGELIAQWPADVREHLESLSAQSGWNVAHSPNGA